MFEERSQQVLLGLTTPQRLTDCPAKMEHIVRDEVGQVHVLGSVPDALHWVKLRSIRWQPFNLKPARESLEQSSNCRSMNLPPVEDQNNSSRQTVQQSLDELFEIIADDVVIKDIKVQTQPSGLRRDANGRNNRKPVPSVPTVMDRGLTFGCPGPADSRLEHKARFVDQNEATTASSGVFLNLASPCFATGQELFGRLRGLDVRVSDNSNPYPLVHARRQRGRSRRRSACGLPWLHGLESTARWGNRASGDLSTVNQPVSAVGERSAWVLAPDEVWPSSLWGHRVDRPRAIGRRHRGKHPASRPPRWANGRLSAEKWPEPVAVGVLRLFLVFSCIKLSATTNGFL